MACKLNKREQKKLQDYFNRLETARADVQIYLDEATQTLGRVLARLTEEYEAKSERWQESEAGEQARELIERLEEFETNVDFYEAEEFCEQLEALLA
jgi:hypothetical protein